MGDTVGKESFTHACISVEKEILERTIEIPDKASGNIISPPGCLSFGQPGGFVLHCIRIVIKRKVFKVFFFENFF